LLAFRRVVGGHPQRALRHADLRRAQPDEGAIEHPRGHAAPVGGVATERFARGAGEREVRNLRPVGRGRDRALHPRTGGIDEEHAELAVARRRGHEYAVGDVGGGHAGLVTVEPPGVAITSGRDLGAEGVVGAGFRQRRGQQDIAGRHAGQPGPLLLR